MYYNQNQGWDPYRSVDSYHKASLNDNRIVPVTVPAVAAKPKKSSALSKKAAGVFLALCVLTSAGLGVGGGVLGWRLASANAPQTSEGATLPLTNTAVSTGGALTTEQIAEKAADSVVEILTEIGGNSNYLFNGGSESGGSAGSGVIISSDGKIITNNHVIDGASKITVTLRNGESYDAELVATDSESDIALLKIEAEGLNAAELGDSDSLKVGEPAVAIGNPLGELGGTVTDGIISALDREITLDGKTMTLLQTNAAINPGNSGGGLFNEQGQLIGLVVAKSSGSGIEGLGFAIPVNVVKSVVSELESNGYVTGRVELGVSLVDITTLQEAMMYRVPQLGVYIAQVSDGTGAAKAGLKAGDCILSVDGTEVSTAAEVKKLLQEHKVGDTVSLGILRNEETIMANVTLTENNPVTDQQQESFGRGGQEF
jgi:serine protease Do